MKRYCQTLTLVDDEQMIAQYVEVEAHAHVWPEVIAASVRSVSWTCRSTAAAVASF